MRHPVAVNRRARHDYELGDRYEAGLVLRGSEVKSLRASGASLREAYAEPKDGELWLVNAHIAPWGSAAKGHQHEPKRPRKLLLQRRQIDRITAAINEQGMTVALLSIYFNETGTAKAELALARGRKTRDRRHDIRKREWQREQARVMRERS